ncbi:DUF2938 domain-containing protein [Parasphingopyxis lamellibrachiae]|uniref:DUF2938 family protein n=1 Tax=Parasphingopyxis lamellibrachiae TaxID=680125 RepID=A0A3D9FHG1_9SPHN|nr:DUF2938 domain-containing protein [Parasphingopyxis lamellibrachiae]RED17234.1 hypothetical protein DFR46_2273 [Parasphingopyxis lamellibrachiae]
MTEVGIFLLHSAAVGMGATLLMDLWTVIRRFVFAIPLLDYGLVGRWLGHIVRGRFRHDAIGAANPIPCERVIGWMFHYLTGMVFAAILLFAWGPDWGRNPTIGPALVVGIGTVAAPFLIMQPAMGSGIAASRTPRPAIARVHSVIAHMVFGLGLYVTASMIVETGFGAAFSSGA